MQRFPDNAYTQKTVCGIFRSVLCEPDGVLRVREVNGGALVCTALRAHIADACVAADACWALSEMLKHELTASIDGTAAASLAEAARRAHPFDVAVQKSASDLTARLLALPSTPTDSGVSLERAALDRVAELQGRRDFASLVRDMNAFPEFEELQVAGCNAIGDIINDGGSQEEAAAAGAIECALHVEALFLHTANTQCNGLRTLVSLTYHHPANILVAGDGGAVSLAVRAIRSFPLDGLVLKCAFKALGCLAVVPRFFEQMMDSGALKLAVCALSRLPKSVDVSCGACFLLMHLTYKSDIAPIAAGMGLMELALSALRNHGGSNNVLSGDASALLRNLCFDESHAVKATQLGAPVQLQAALKAHLSDVVVQQNAAVALARIQRFVDAASARDDATMAELIAGEEAAKRDKGGAAALRKAGKGKGMGGDGAKSGDTPILRPRLPPPITADGEPVLTKAQIKRRKAKTAAAARKAAAASGSAAGEEEEEEEGSDASSGDSEPPRSRPPIDFSKDAEFRRRLPPITNSPLVISPELLAASDAILAAHAALYSPNPSSTQPDAGDASVQTTSDAAGEEEGAGADWPTLSRLTTLAEPAVAVVTAPRTVSPEPAPSYAAVVAEAAALRAALAAKEVENAALRAEVAAAAARVAALEAELASLRR